MGKKELHRIDNKKKEIISSILLAAALLLFGISRISQEFARWYSKEIYTIWVNIIGRTAGCFPFSVSEVLLYSLIAGILVSLVRSVWKKEIAVCLMNLYLFAGIFFFLYVMNCGINYHREPFAESAGIEERTYSAEELKEVCRWLTEEVNVWSSQVDRDKKGVMRIDADREWKGTKSVNTMAVKAMENLGKSYPELSGYYPKPKALLVPWILSVQNLSGIYSPFTIEANYNSAMTDYNIPFTACHELSHLRGFMQEEEANFIAYLACSRAENPELRYSGNLLGWVYCMNVLYKVDYEAWEEIREELSAAVEPDLRENREFWGKYDGTVAEVANKVNDTYLKANGQDDGVKSYDRMVDLVVAYYLAGEDGEK